jgi:hypothetical protein
MTATWAAITPVAVYRRARTANPTTTAARVMMASAMPATRMSPIISHDRATNWRWAEKHKARPVPRAVSRKLQNATRQRAKLKAPVERLTMRRHLVRRAKLPRRDCDQTEAPTSAEKLRELQRRAMGVLGLGRQAALFLA